MGGDRCLALLYGVSLVVWLWLYWRSETPREPSHARLRCRTSQEVTSFLPDTLRARDDESPNGFIFRAGSGTNTSHGVYCTCTHAFYSLTPAVDRGVALARARCLSLSLTFLPPYLPPVLPPSPPSFPLGCLAMLYLDVVLTVRISLQGIRGQMWSRTAVWPTGS